MKASTRIILNTAASYGRSVFAIGMSLFSTRWVLQALGQSDYGLFGVVGSLIVMITFLNAGLQVGVTRFYAYAIGEGENESSADAVDRLQRWFNTAFSIHLVLPSILVLIGWPIGEYVIQHYLTIPVGRMEASLTVFRVSLCTAFMTVFSVPFLALYAAHQKIVELSVFGILRSCAVFVLAWCLLHISSDRLVVYACAMAAINVGIFVLQITRSILHFPACRLRFDYMFNRTYFKKLFSFVGWKTFSMTCVTMRAQGTPMLVNLQFGPLVNAAYSVAFGLSTQATALSQSLTSAFRPAAISAEGKGERKVMLAMALQACKFGSLLIILFAIPLILEMDNLLHLWLGESPKYGAPICQWMLAMLIVERMTAGHMIAVNAYGKIGLYEVLQGGAFLSSLPLMWGLFQLNWGPEAIGVALFASALLFCTIRVVFAKYLLDFPVLLWGRQVAAPILLILIVVSIVGSFGMSGFAEGFFRLILTSVICVMITLLLAWMCLFDGSEKGFMLRGIKQLCFKMPFLRKSISK